jgi:hypothetical protein
VPIDPAHRAPFWKGVAIGALSVVGLLVLTVLVSWLAMGTCPMCGRMR